MQPSRCLRNGIHHDLASFLSYARRTGLNPASTVFVGTRYEYVAHASLSRLGLLLTRTGGSLDKGIDLLGTWSLPSLPKAATFRMIVQCKAYATKIGPNLVRELEGAFAAVPSSWSTARVAMDEDGKENGSGAVTDHVAGTMALLVAPQQATKGVRDAMTRSRRPMGFAKMDMDGVLQQLLWNKRATDLGLEGIGVSTRYRDASSSSPKVSQTNHGKMLEEVMLTWNGNIWEFNTQLENEQVTEMDQAG